MTRIRGHDVLTITQLDGQRVLVVLGGKDMSDFALDFREMDMDNAHARKILLRLTRLACRKSGIDTRGKRVHIEALPMGESCYLLVSVNSEPKRYRLKHGGSRCFVFADVTAFLNAVEAAYRSSYYRAKVAAFAYRGGYALVFDYPSLPRSLCRLLGEFAEASGGALFAAHVRETGKPLCAHNAVTVIGEQLI